MCTIKTNQLYLNMKRKIWGFSFHLIKSCSFSINLYRIDQDHQDAPQKPAANIAMWKTPKYRIFSLGQYWKCWRMRGRCFVRGSSERPGLCCPGCQHFGMLVAKLSETYPKRVCEDAFNTLLFICKSGCPHRAVVIWFALGFRNFLNSGVVLHLSLIPYRKLSWG